MNRRCLLPLLAILPTCLAIQTGCSSAGPSPTGAGGASGQIGTGGRPATGGAAGSQHGNDETGGNAGGAGASDAAGGRSSTGGAAGNVAGGRSGTGGLEGVAGAGGGSVATGGATGGAVGTPSGGVAGGTGGKIGGGGGSASGGATGSTATGGTAGGGAVGSASGGVAGGGTAGNSTGGKGGGDSFALAWQDDFDKLDTSLWQAQSFTWDGNQAQFTPQNVSVADGKLNLALTSAPAGSAKPYLGVELRSTKTLTYGKVSASMRFASGSGVVSGLVLFYTPYPNCDWNEIDIEHLGNSSKTSQLNCQVYSGTVTSTCTTSVTPTQDPQVVSLGVDAETAFHQYDIEWTPAGVKFFLDGTLLRTWSASISRLKLPQNILLTIWASNSSSWAGALGPSSVPTSAQVDWIKVYQLQ